MSVNVSADVNLSDVGDDVVWDEDGQFVQFVIAALGPPENLDTIAEELALFDALKARRKQMKKAGVLR